MVYSSSLGERSPPETEPVQPQHGLRVALDNLRTVLLLALDMLKVLLFGLPQLVVEMYSMLVPRAKKDVRGQLVLVTGGGNGLGRATAHLLAKRGARLVLVDVDLDAAERVCEELRQAHGTAAWAYRVDVSRYDECRQLADCMERDGCGPVDILVNNAGLIVFEFLQDIAVERATAVIDVNVKSHIWMTKVFLDGMIKRKSGHIVGVSSMSGMYAFPWATIYSSTKFAVCGFMASLEEQLRIQGHGAHVKTTCVNPYYIATRKDVVEFLQKPRFPPLTVEHAARELVNGILREDHVVTIPRLFGVSTRFMLLFPVTVQQIVRDYLIREYELNNNV